MDNIEYYRLIIDYIDNEGDLEEIIKPVNERNLYGFLSILGEISFVHTHYNDPDKQARRICEIIEPLSDMIRKVLSEGGNIVNSYIVDHITKTDRILSKITDLQTKYSYYNCKFRRNDNENKRKMRFRTKYLHNIVAKVMIVKLGVILNILDDVEKEFVRIINHEGECNCDDITPEGTWDAYKDLLGNDWQWNKSYGKIEGIYNPDYPTGEMNSEFDTLHDLLLFLNHYFRHNARIKNRIYVYSSLNYASLYDKFKLNKRVLKYLLEKGLLIEAPRFFDYELYKSEFDEIIDYDDVERFVSYITVTNYDLDTEFKDDNYIFTSFASIKKQYGILEYVAMKGSYNIFKYLANRLYFDEDCYPYAIHGGNTEIIHYIEDNTNVKFHKDLYRVAIKAYNFHVLEYICNIYADNIYNYLVNEKECVIEWLFSEHGKDVIRLMNADKDTGIVFFMIDFYSDRKLSELLITDHYEEICNMIDLSKYEQYDRADYPEYTRDDPKKMLIYAYMDVIIDELYNKHFDYTYDIIRNGIHKVYPKLCRFSMFHDKYMEIAQIYKDKFLEYIHYDFTKVWNGF